MKRFILVVLVTLALNSPSHAKEDTYADWLEVCGLMGTNAVRIVRARDAGMPLTSLLSQLFPHGTEGAVETTMSTLTLEIYRRSYWDATEARRQIETQCVTHIPKRFKVRS